MPVFFSCRFICEKFKYATFSASPFFQSLCWRTAIVYLRICRPLSLPMLFMKHYHRWVQLIIVRLRTLKLSSSIGHGKRPPTIFRLLHEEDRNAQETSTMPFAHARQSSRSGRQKTGNPKVSFHKVDSLRIQVFLYRDSF